MIIKENQIRNAKESFALAIYATTHGIEAAQRLAEEKGLLFDKEIALKHIAAFLGADVAAGQRAIWDDAKMQELREKVACMIDKESGKRRLHYLATSLLITVTRTAQDLINSLSPAHWQQSELALMGANRGSAVDAMRGETDKLPKIEPSLDIEGNFLYIGLVLASEGHALPTSQDAMLLFIDSEQITEFEFDRGHDKAIDLTVRVSDEYVARAGEKGVTLRYNPDLKEIAVIIGNDFEESR